MMNISLPFGNTPNTAETNCPTNTDTKLPIKHPPNQTYSQPAIRQLQGPQDPLEPIHKVKVGIEPNLDLRKILLTRKA